ncbi:hypothetical protein K445DRAFT_23221 [Daldinia sp. EC12]|nr:hypothetical protein K445DRAFT_23221 [Daldinia sp. EC12]
MVCYSSAFSPSGVYCCASSEPQCVASEAHPPRCDGRMSPCAEDIGGGCCAPNTECASAGCLKVYRAEPGLATKVLSGPPTTITKTTTVLGFGTGVDGVTVTQVKIAETGQSAGPCSLIDFMNYLIYIERRAENLQFFLWYCNYVERWTQLSRIERERSPAWGPGKRAYIKARPRSTRLGERVDKLSRRLEILDGYTPMTTPEPTLANKPESKIGVDVNFSKPRALALPSGVKEEAQDEWQWQPFSAQPFRDEVTQVARQYISIFGARRLSLTHEERTACLHALQHTTHPSSFILAFLSAETELRRRSHPNFIRWCTCNTNSSRVLCARTLGTVLIILAVLLNVILILSTADRLSRLSAVPLWYAGFYTLLIEGRGISIRLYMNQKRQSRPWERPTNSKMGVTSVNPKADDFEQIELGDGKSSPRSEGQDMTMEDYPMKEESVKVTGLVDDLTKGSWVELYRQKSIWQKVFDVSVFLSGGIVSWFSADTL